MIRFFFLTALLSLPAFGTVTRVHSLTPGFIKFSNGQVGFWKNEALYFHQYLIGQSVAVELDADNHILSIIPVFETTETPPFESYERADFTPTIISSYSVAIKLLESFSNSDIAGSQCYDRAHIWAFSAAKNYVHLEKAWIFFADHFIEKNHFKWWFHVAPIAKVKMQGTIQERIVDRKFSEFPLKVKLWTDLFMLEKQTCKEVDRYTDYSEHPGEDDCYLITSTPYFWQPKDLEAYAKHGTEKSGWIEWEVRHAFKHAFGINK